VHRIDYYPYGSHEFSKYILGTSREPSQGHSVEKGTGQINPQTLKLHFTQGFSLLYITDFSSNFT
jgi:hypothetical protein